MPSPKSKLKQGLAGGKTPPVPRNVQTKQPLQMNAIDGGVNPALQPTLNKPKKGSC